jgi:DNA-binding transcriptional LysR family regulator
MRCDARLLGAFVVLADELHFGRAAARLGVTQPALSQQIKRLELQLGTPLFTRTRSSVALTAAGEAGLPHARHAVTATDAAVDAARAAGHGEREQLRLGISPGTHYVAQTLLARLARERPAVRVRARQDSSGALAALVARGELDLALGFCTEPRPGAAVERLLTLPAVAAVARDHRLADRAAVALAELADETFALVDEHDGPGYNSAVRARCRAAGFEPRTPPSPQGPMAWELAVREGGCVGLTTRASAAATAHDVRLLSLRPVVRFPIDLARSTSAPTPAAAAAFAALVRQHAPAAAQAGGGASA